MRRQHTWCRPRTNTIALTNAALSGLQIAEAGLEEACKRVKVHPSECKLLHALTNHNVAAAFGYDCADLMSMI